MRTLLKSVTGGTCEIYAVSHHSRFRVGTAEPTVEIYEDSRTVPAVGTAIRRRTMLFSVIICPDPEMDGELTNERFRGLVGFDLALKLPRKDGVLAPFTLYGVAAAELSPDRWTFQITDPETVRKLLDLV